VAHPLTWIGVSLILIGVALVLLPIIGRYVDLARIPWWLVYVYRSNGFYFVTSPLLIMLSLLSVVIHFLKR
jgi:hypothetical protein